MSHVDSMISRLESEIAEKDAQINAILSGAEERGDDATDQEMELVNRANERITKCREQLETLGSTSKNVAEARKRHNELEREFSRLRTEADHGPVEYRSIGEYVRDVYASKYDLPGVNRKVAGARLEQFLELRVADHQTTADNVGLIPEPVIGPVINFIDAARPLVNVVGPQAMPARDWRRPHVTQHTSVALQGTNGAPADEKTELVSQAMTITDINLSAVTYGGYVNVSRQNIDFSSPQVFDIIVNDLAAQYAIQTEAALGDSLAGTTTTPVSGGTTAEDLAEALWDAVATVYTATRGQGRLVLAVAPDVLGTVGPLFAPVSPRDAQSPGFNAGMFGQGVMGNISGIDVVMSSGLTGAETFLFSTAAVEAWEQRVGTLQVVEPSVLGVQIAYAGYFTPTRITDGGIVPITITT